MSEGPSTTITVTTTSAQVRDGSYRESVCTVLGGFNKYPWV